MMEASLPEENSHIPDPEEGQQSRRRTRQPSRKHKRSKVRSLPQSISFVKNPLVLSLSSLLFVAWMISMWLGLVHPDEQVKSSNSGAAQMLQAAAQQQQQQRQQAHISSDRPPHLYPRLPHLPAFAEIENGEALAQQTLQGQPTLAGLAAILNNFTQALHHHNLELSASKAAESQIIRTYYSLAYAYLHPLEKAYRDRNIFEIREDDSIYMSLAAFREHLLSQTLQSAFDQALHPDKLFVGVIVQNCFGMDGRQCRTGLQVVGKDANGRDQVKQFDAPPDTNGIETFCNMTKYQKYCDRGQIRALYIHDTDALGPAVARYYASKLWGGETYFLQMDSHLEFAPQWDYKYIEEVKLARNFPKAILSAYPPGFQDFGTYQGGTPGSRLCSCQFSPNGVESHIIRINVGGRTPADAVRPTQIAFIAAGFFFARAEFLQDVPFDPYVPWCFMGEEIALSMRAWTAGWDIYAPRQNLIAHQYRPGRLGLPKFWESVGRDSKRPNLNTRLQASVIRRIKHMVGYPTDTKELIEKDGNGIVLTDLQHYSMGKVRTAQAYLDFTKIDVEGQTCRRIDWCNKGELE